MKNKTLFIAILALALTGGACKKTYTCECSTTSAIVIPGYFTLPLPSQSETKAYSQKMTEKQAQAACDHEAESIETIEKGGIDENELSNGTGVQVQFNVDTKCKLK